MKRQAVALLVGLGLWAIAPGLAAQESAASPVLTVDQDRLFAESLWGKRVLGELDAASAALLAENRKIEASLTAEETALTAKRPTMAATAFRELADEFDARVTGIRKAQDSKGHDLGVRRDADRKRFFEAAVPVMVEVLNARGAFAILDGRAVILSVKAIDATDDMRRAIDAQLGDGSNAAP